MELFIKVLKKLKIKNIVLLILLLVFNTYAWFIYETRVASDISVHISSWNVEFSIGDNENITNIIINIDRIYPGMEPTEKKVVVKNKGEIKAELDYQIKSFRVLEEKYKVGDNIEEDELLQKISTKYPFKINVSKDDALLSQGIGDGEFVVTVEWPFESGDDELDTLWGKKAYDYYLKNSESQSMEIEIILIAQQIDQSIN